jgi:carboxymethylenebutenolidase
VGGQRVEITTEDGVADAYLVRPGGQPRGSVLLIMDAYGLRPQIEQMAERIAAEGYIVLAPNVFYREARGELLPAEEIAGGGAFAKVLPLVRGLTPDLIVRDGPAYLDALGDGPVAITGYCMGGRAGWHLAAAYPDRVAALGGFHVGGLVTDVDDSPHRKAADIGAEVYFGHADNDRSMNPDQIATLDKAMDDAGVVHRTEVYDGAAHGYTMADTPAYDEAAAERHYRELFALLDRTFAA